MANLSTLSSGSSTTLTVTAGQFIVLNNAPTATARLEIASGVGAGNVIAANHNGRKVYGPFSAGTITLSATNGECRYELSGDTTSSLDDDTQPLSPSEIATVRASVSGGGNSSGGLDMRLKGLWKAAYSGVTVVSGVATFATPTIRAAVFGDSVGNSKPQFMTPRLKQMFGNAGGNFENVSVASGATAGSDANDGTYWINGNVYTVPAGGTVEYLQAGGRVNATKLKLYYVKQPGAGTFKIQLNYGAGYADEAGFTAIDASNASITAGVATITKVTGSTWSLRVVGVSGTVRVLFATYEDEATKGLHLIRFDSASLKLETALATPVAIRDFVFTDLALDVAFAEWKDNAEFAVSFPAWASYYQALRPATSWLYFGTSPEYIETTTGSFNQVNNALIKAWCDANEHAYFDGYTPIAPYSRLVALGWEGDGTHLGPQANAYVASLAWRALGFDDLMLVPSSKPLQTNAITLQDGTLTWARNGVTTGIIGEVGTDNDLVIRANRSVRFKTIGGITAGCIATGGETTIFPALGIGTPYTAVPTWKSVSSSVIKLVDKDSNTPRTVQAAAFTVI